MYKKIIINVAVLIFLGKTPLLEAHAINSDTFESTEKTRLDETKKAQLKSKLAQFKEAFIAFFGTAAIVSAGAISFFASKCSCKKKSIDGKCGCHHGTQSSNDDLPKLSRSDFQENLITSETTLRRNVEAEKADHNPNAPMLILREDVPSRTNEAQGQNIEDTEVPAPSISSKSSYLWVALVTVTVAILFRQNQCSILGHSESCGHNHNSCSHHGHDCEHGHGSCSHHHHH